jgi:hypothetical protein
MARSLDEDRKGQRPDTVPVIPATEPMFTIEPCKEGGQRSMQPRRGTVIVVGGDRGS